jgi:hypothetical protein
MSNNKIRKLSYQEVLVSVKAEMAEPCVAGSARTEAVNVSAAMVKEAAKP